MQTSKWSTNEADDGIAALLRDLDREFGQCGADEPRRPYRPGIALGRDDAPSVWRTLRRHLPRDVVRLFEKIDVTRYRIDALHNAERRLFGWSERYWAARAGRARRWELVTPVMVASAYREALSRQQRSRTLQQIGWAIDLTLHAAQVRNLEGHETPTALPEWQLAKAMTCPTGVLEVHDVERPEPTCGVRSFMEATPIEVVTYTLDVYRACGASLSRRLRIWDLTAGSGTVFDVGRFYEADVLATDLTFDNHQTKFSPVQNVGGPPWHMKVRKQFTETFAPRDVITSPDVVFFDPGSRGAPSVSELYYGQHDPRDLAGLDRDVYLDTIVAVVRTAIDRLADGGLVSLIVREGVRNHQHVAADPGLADEIQARVADVAFVVERLNLAFAGPVKQVSLGSTRVPAVHLLLTRDEW